MLRRNLDQNLEQSEGEEAKLVKILSIFGTRPEAIKMAPVLRALSDSDTLESIVCVSGQHRDLLDQVLTRFSIFPHFDLNLMIPTQDLFHITQACISVMKGVIAKTSPDLVLVHGDTSTAFSAALSAFYSGIQVAHIEAGLRSHNPQAPFPEEMNRRMIASLSRLHFAPCQRAKNNLLKENIDEKSIFITGNTGIDALYQYWQHQDHQPELDKLISNRKIVLMTIHRREVDSSSLSRVFEVVSQFAREHPDFVVIYPLHPSKRVSDLARLAMHHMNNIALVKPLDYQACVYLLGKSHFVVSDSGGLQEEAPALGKPILVLREKTERPEILEEGAGILVGQDSALLLKLMRQLAQVGSPLHQSMSQVCTPYGNGRAATRIVEIIEGHFCKNPVQSHATPLKHQSSDQYDLP